MSSPSLIASFGHSGSHAPQLMQSDVMYVAIGRVLLDAASYVELQCPHVNDAASFRWDGLGPSGKGGLRGSAVSALGPAHPPSSSLNLANRSPSGRLACPKNEIA